MNRLQSKKARKQLEPVRSAHDPVAEKKKASAEKPAGKGTASKLKSSATKISPLAKSVKPKSDSSLPATSVVAAPVPPAKPTVASAVGLVKTAPATSLRRSYEQSAVRIPGLKLPIPPILMEGDEPAPPHRAGPGEKFALSVEAPSKKVPTHPQHLPASYGTGKLTAIARDPHCIFVHWDFSDDQQQYYNSLSADHHLVLRAHLEAVWGPAVAEVHVHSESRDWFFHVPRPATTYEIELGYYHRDGSWMSVRSSALVSTPADMASDDKTVQFGIARVEAPAFGARGAEQSFNAFAPGGYDTPTAPAVPESRPSPRRFQNRWTIARERALAELISVAFTNRQVIGSLEIIELLRRQVEQEEISLKEQSLLPGGPSSVALGISSLQAEAEQVESSPFGGGRPSPRKSFWFNVNAELIVYGATEPGASLTIGGRAISLRPDGTFSYRFALPDGDYELPVAAMPADQSEVRHAELRFGRQTAYRGEVGAHPQDQSLRIPHADNVE